MGSVIVWCGVAGDNLDKGSSAQCSVNREPRDTLAEFNDHDVRRMVCMAAQCVCMYDPPCYSGVCRCWAADDIYLAISFLCYYIILFSY